MNDQALFSILGTAYGGDGLTRLRAARLRGLAAAGGGPLQPRTAASLSMAYMIAPPPVARGLPNIPWSARSGSSPG